MRFKSDLVQYLVPARNSILNLHELRHINNLLEGNSCLRRPVLPSSFPIFERFFKIDLVVLKLNLSLILNWLVGLSIGLVLIYMHLEHIVLGRVG